VSFRVRPVRSDDFEAVYEMAKLTGGGFTNLPPDRGALVEKIVRSEHAFARETGGPADDLFMFVLENVETGQIRGTCQIFSQVGTETPFYSYRISTLTQTSKALGKTFRNEMLNLVTDFDGCSEVGGLFLHPGERAGGLGMLLARSRYLFIKLHRERFAKKLLAELRGVIDEGGGSPFWDAIAGRFFGMDFREADEFNATHGTQFIADLMPKTPIYTAMLPEAARAVMGVPHPSGRAAMKMLEREGFAWECYIDIFDGGPTMVVATDQIRTIRESREEVLGGVTREGESDGGQAMLIAAGRLKDFSCCWTRVKARPDEGVDIDPKAAEMLSLRPGDRFLAASR
jgi:arginine N-succinyltransferase